MQLIRKHQWFGRMSRGVAYVAIATALCYFSFCEGVRSRVRQMEQVALPKRIETYLLWHDICAVSRETGLSGAGHFFKEWVVRVCLLSALNQVANNEKVSKEIPHAKTMELARMHCRESTLDHSPCMFLSPFLVHFGTVSGESATRMKEAWRYGQ